MSTRSVVLVPTWGAAGERFPVLVALHGRGEARKPPAEGALGWARDYGLVRAIDRVASPPLESADFEGFVDASRLDFLNAGLSTQPFRGLIVACPYVPDVDLADDDAMHAFGTFLKDTLLPRVRRDTPAIADAASTGIDGVSLGGAVALSVGLDSPTSFGAVGTLQPAIDVKDVARWTTRAQRARQANPTLALRLLTSDGDYFRDAVRATSAAWTAAGVTHELEQARGPHDYPFNRGPGSIEMLLWHDRQLRRHA
jgi:enterochelin esterase-like enzyme